MDNFDTSKWLKDQYLEEAGLLTEANIPSPNFFYAMHKILKNFLDEKAVEAGDRMSYFSAEWPLSTAFESYMRKQLEGTPINEAEGDFSELKAKLEADPDNKYLTFTDKGTQLRVNGRNGALDDFIRKYENQDLGDYKLFFVDDEDRGWIVSINKK